MEIFTEKLKDVLQSVLPITLLVVLLHFTIAPLETVEVQRFLFGALLIVVGLAIFLFGVDIGIAPIGNFLGKGLARSGKLKVVLLMGLLLGFFISIAEPDLHILSTQVAAVTDDLYRKNVLLLVVSIGIAASLSLGLFRIVRLYPLNKLFTFLYIGIFILAFFSSNDLFAIAFDASGSTTGALTVPFMLALAIGVASMNRSSQSAEENSFGLVGIASTGAILAVLILGLFVHSDEPLSGSIPAGPDLTAHWFLPFQQELPKIAGEILLAVSPILIIFVIYHFFFSEVKLPNVRFKRIFFGMAYLFIGLVLFLVGVNAGFMEVGRKLGMLIAGLPSSIPVLVIGFLLGVLVILAEPAVYVLTHEIEDVTNGSVKRTVVLFALSIGVGLAVLLSVIRVLVPWLELWHFLVPGYLIAIILSYRVPNLFVGMAFDAGGVASGPMTATFILAFIQGVAEITPDANVLLEGFGMIAMVAMMPILSLQLLGIISKRKKKEGFAVSDQLEKDVLYDAIFVIVNIGKANKVLAEAKKKGITGGTIFPASGTVSSNLLRTIGFNEVKKEILFMVSARENTAPAVDHITTLFDFEQPNRGILFSTPVVHLLGTHGENLDGTGPIIPLAPEYEAFLTMVEAGFGEFVVEAARSAGARGGTLFHGHGVLTEPLQKVFAIELAPHQDIVITLVTASIADAVEAAIVDRLHLDEPGNGILFSFDAENVRGIR